MTYHLILRPAQKEMQTADKPMNSQIQFTLWYIYMENLLLQNGRIWQQLPLVRCSLKKKPHPHPPGDGEVPSLLGIHSTL